MWNTEFDSWDTATLVDITLMTLSFFIINSLLHMTNINWMPTKVLGMEEYDMHSACLDREPSVQ